MPVNIKDNKELNAYLDETERKIGEIALHAVKVDDIDLIKKEHEDLKVIAEGLVKRFDEIKEVQKIQYLVKSEDERKHEFGRFLFAMQNNDMKTIYEMGGRLNMNSKTDEWKPKKEWNVGEKAATNLGTPLRGDAVTGSILIPETFTSEVLRIPEDGSGMMGKVRSIPMNTRIIHLPKTLAGVAFTWVTNEVTAKTEDNPTFSEVDLECETAAAWVALTEEFMEDSLVDMGAYLSELFREAWQKEFDTQVLVANTAPFIGMTRATTVNIVNMAAGKTSFSDATADDILDLIQALDTQTKRAGASFIMHTTVLDDFKRLKDDNGNYLYANPGGVQPQTFWGYPIIFSDAMPDSASDAISTGFVAFGNPKQWLHGNRVGLEFRMFSETSDALVYDRNFFRVRLRQGFIAGNPEGISVLKTPAA